jgi:prophage maintenance system killer protein
VTAPILGDHEVALEAVTELAGLETVGAQAAHYLHALVMTQPFCSGNDRVGIACLLLWPRAHRYWELPDQVDLLRVTVLVQEGLLDEAELTDLVGSWLEVRSAEAG